MLVYSAGQTLTLEKMSGMADESGQSNFLFSFADKQSRKCARYFCTQSHRRLIVDSGAFSVWSRGEELTLESYISFCREIQALAKCQVTFISLDVIAGSRDIDALPTREQSEVACKKSWENYQKMRAAGIPAIPTFHQFDDFEWLYVMAQDSDYIAVSPRKSIVGQESKMEWLTSVFAGLELQNKVHGLGIAGSPAMENFPFYSIDSTAWLRCGSGTFRYFDGRHILAMDQDEWRHTDAEHKWDDGTDAVAEARTHYHPPGTGGNYHFMMRGLAADARLQRFLTQLWQERGFPAGEVVAHNHPTETTCHLCNSASLHADFCRIGDWRDVADRRKMDPEYVGWAVHLAMQTALWQSHRRGELGPQALLDKVWQTMWDGQLNLAHNEWEENRTGKGTAQKSE